MSIDNSTSCRRCPKREGPASSRRDFLKRAGAGFGMLALAGLMDQEKLLGEEETYRSPLAPKPGHLPAKAKSIIWLFMEGGPSGVDLFDPKPELTRRHGQRVVDIQTHFGNPGPLLKSPYSFKQYGQSGAWVCEKYPTLANCVDDIAFIKSVYTESNNHAPAMYQMNTGITRPGLPSAGAWVTYGLGTENQNLPGFIVMAPGVGKGGPNNWGSGFLPSAYQGTLLRSKGQAILNLKRPAGVSADDQREMLDLAATLNQRHLQSHLGEPDLQGRIESYELAWRMQMAAPDVIDLSKESDATRKLYGLNLGGGTAEFGEKCLKARRLVEKGVRFVQVYSNDEWDAHGSITQNHNARCAETDVPIAGLIADLKQRGLFDSTLIVWGGEFGRMPVSEQGSGGDHNPHGFTMWMAGAGIKGGISYGETDEIGYAAAADKVSVPDIHATMLHLLGIDHKRLTYKHNGRMYRLTDVSGNVIQKVLA